MIPEALCVEAPKGRPMIRSESPEALCVDAPQGQPVIHRPRPRQPRNGPTVVEEKRSSLGKAKDPPSSRWTRRGVSDGGDLSPEPRQEELVPSGRKRKGP